MLLLTARHRCSTFYTLKVLWAIVKFTVIQLLEGVLKKKETHQPAFLNVLFKKSAGLTSVSGLLLFTLKLLAGFKGLSPFTFSKVIKNSNSISLIDN